MNIHWTNQTSERKHKASNIGFAVICFCVVLKNGNRINECIGKLIQHIAYIQQKSLAQNPYRAHISIVFIFILTFSPYTNIYTYLYSVCHNNPLKNNNFGRNNRWWQTKYRNRGFKKKTKHKQYFQLNEKATLCHRKDFW